MLSTTYEAGAPLQCGVSCHFLHARWLMPTISDLVFRCTEITEVGGEFCRDKLGTLGRLSAMSVSNFRRLRVVKEGLAGRDFLVKVFFPGFLTPHHKSVFNCPSDV